MSKESWAVVKYAANQAEASIIKGLLESEGIPVMVKQEAIGAVYGLTTDGLGQTRVLVPESHKNIAEKLLAPPEDS